LCPGPNPDLGGYKKNIKKLVLILKGKRNTALSSLKKEMKIFSKEKRFEEAAKIRDRIYSLQQVMLHAHVIENGKNIPTAGASDMLQKITSAEKPISRIECYDVSNIQGKLATGSMAVFVDGKPEKSEYKKFKIKMENEPNDIAMLKEVLERRFLHPEWKYPEIILIDGGIAQLNIAIKTKNEKKETKSIKVISIAKGRQELFIEDKGEPIPLKNLSREIYNLIKLLDDEAHRFAIAYHKKLRKKALLN
jgi:excinuclease ABC subunit C